MNKEVSINSKDCQSVCQKVDNEGYLNKYVGNSTGLPCLLKSPHVSSNFKFFLKSPLISSENVDFQENL